MYEVFAYWNADMIRSVLNGVALLMNGPDYLGLMKALAVGALLVSVGTAFARMKGEEPVAYFLMLALFYGVLFVPKTTVSINDTRAAKVYTVANVPLGLAFFAATTSHIGKWLTDSYETFFMDVDDLKFGNTGMAFGARMTREMMQARVVTPSLNRDLVDFTANCINPELLNTPQALNDLSSSGNLWTTIGNSSSSFSLNPGRATSVNNTAMSCTDAYSSLDMMLLTEANNQISALGKKLNPSNAMADVVIQSQLPTVEAAMLGISRSGQDSMKQSFAANMLFDAQPIISAINGDSQGAAIKWAAATAEQSSIVSYGAMASVAESALPKLRNAIELLILALFPIIFLLIIVAGPKAGLVLKAYLMGMVWVQLWAPLYAVINYMSNVSDSERFIALIGSAGPTMQTMGKLSDLALSQSSIAGLLTISVPVIAFAIVKGGEMAMSSAVGQIMSPSQGAAQRAGDAAGQGNIGGGQVSWGNTSMNTWGNGNFSQGNAQINTAGGNSTDFSQKWADPGNSTYTGSNGVIQRDGAGNITGAKRNTFDAGGSVDGSASMGRSNTWSSADSVRAGQEWSSQLQQSSASTNSQSSAGGFMRQLSDSVNAGTSSGGRYSQNWTAGGGNSSSVEKGGSSALTNQETSRFGSLVGASGGASTGGGGGGGGKSASAKAGGSFDTAQTQGLIDQAFNKNGNTNSQDQKYAAGVLQEHAKSIASSSGDQNVRSAAQAFSADLQNAVRASSSSGASLGKTSEASQGRQDSITNSAGGKMSTGKPVFDQLIAMGGGGTSNQEVNAALGRANDPGALSQATQAAAAGFKQSEGGGWMGQGGAKGPRSMSSVEGQGRAGVASQGGAGSGAVAAHHAAGTAAVNNATGGLSAKGMPDKSGVDKAYSDGAGAAHGGYTGHKDAAQVNGGADIAASAVYKANQGGIGTQIANTFFGGYGYESENVTASHLKAAAAQNPALANELKNIQKTGIVSKGQQEFVENALNNYKP